MIDKGIISEIKNYERVSLNETTHTFLNFISQQEYSSYELFKRMKEFKKPMTYKNVRMRIKNLYDWGLIEVSDKKFSRNAKKYRLTSRGLFERLLMPTVTTTFLDSNRNNLILKTILYQFFQEETIRKFNGASIFLDAYLRNCCRAILDYLERQRRFTKHYASFFTKKVNVDQIVDYETGLDEVITNQARNFVLQIVKDSIYEYRERDGSKEDKGFTSNFPTWELTRDKKFMTLLYKVKKDFDDGCKFFLKSRLP